MGVVKIMSMMIMINRMMVMEIIRKYERTKNSYGANHASTRLTRGPSVAARSEVSGKYSK